ncbi:MULTISPECIES: M23 family metallopeptidase [unclassified Virgibacillus]|uniref:M23 family metallopeptidase n=1 Tax=unclassified Virgibacillus TaxID=2620237 RepID=UPI000909C66D|nr:MULTISPECIES: M23 family metallopeptidase [unclassified Virgibacillus]API91804.1 stage II sporulation protein [Virgibacillus sp. 6R]MBS7427930.1 peptidoglycan DD-metalloendopeptidase family protein [Virgibacillus sp. 19R1-5]
MKEENKGTSKNKWSRIFRKKWFFPAVYLTIAAVLLSVVVWYQNIDNQVPDAQEETDEFIPAEHGERAEPVLEQQETIQMPVTNPEEAEIVTKFYDYNAEQEEQEQALVLYNNKYYESDGVNIASASGESFDVVAALSGEVTEVKEDPLLGNVVVLAHEDDVTTYYASLEEVNVKPGSEVKQGDTLGIAGKSVFAKDSGTHVYFELRKNDNEVNPEAYFNQPVSSLSKVTEEKSEDVDAQKEAEQSENDEAEGEQGDEPSSEEAEDANEKSDKESDEVDNPDATEEMDPELNS